MNSGITVQEINRLFDYLKESNNSDTTILIHNDMCKELYNLLLNCTEYQKIKNKEIERLNNIINELEKWLDNRQNSSVFYEEYENADVYGIVFDKLQELKGDGSNE